MQTPNQSVPAPAAAQTPAPQISITTTGPNATTQTLTIPGTRAEVEELMLQRAELSEQLISAANRRANLSDQLRSDPNGVSRAGLEERIRVLDQRIIQLETDIATTGRQVSSAPGGLGVTVGTGSQSGMIDEDDVLVMGAFNFLVLIPLLLFIARRRWKRAGVRSPMPNAESGERLERVERAVEAIAIEIERVSEGQRFVTKLLSESPVVGNANRAIPDRVGAEQR